MAQDGGPKSLPFEPRVWVYSAVLDGETCPACAAEAGLEYDLAIEGAPRIPNPACTRPGGCRCSWI